MKQELSEFIGNLSPEKRAVFLQKLKAGKPGIHKTAEELQTYRPGPNDNYYNFIEKEGNFNSIVLKQKTLHQPVRDQIQIKVKAASLNFRDLMIALNMYPATPGIRSVMGSDYAGVVTAVGDEVVGFKPGDEVFCLAVSSLLPDDSQDELSHFSAYITVKAVQVAHKPANISWEDAACIPTVFLTSYFALHYAARLQKGEHVLIHTATGGVGLAAIQIAKWLGAKISVTAGTDVKRDYLERMGFEHPMDSRSLDFAKQIKEATGGEGVDVILNTISGQAAAEGINILNTYGRFLQIDKRDIAENAVMHLGNFNRGLTYTAIDLGLFYWRQGEIKKLLDEIALHFKNDDFNPIPFTSFNIAELGLAFTTLSRAQHIGKIVLVY